MYERKKISSTCLGHQNSYFLEIAGGMLNDILRVIGLGKSQPMDGYRQVTAGVPDHSSQIEPERTLLRGRLFVENSPTS